MQGSLAVEARSAPAIAEAVAPQRLLCYDEECNFTATPVFDAA
jgi:hypothetical protein